MAQKFFYILTVLIFFGTKEIAAQNCWRNTYQFKGDTSVLGLKKSEKKLYMDNIKRIKKCVEAYPVQSDFIFRIIPDLEFTVVLDKGVFHGQEFMYTDSIGEICIEKTFLTFETDSDNWFSFHLCEELYRASRKTFSAKHKSVGMEMPLKVRKDFHRDSIVTLKFLINLEGFSMFTTDFHLWHHYSPFIYRGIDNDAARYVASRVCRKANPKANLADIYDDSKHFNLFEFLEKQNWTTSDVVAEYAKYSDLSGFIETLSPSYQKFFDTYFLTTMTKEGCSLLTGSYK